MSSMSQIYNYTSVVPPSSSTTTTGVGLGYGIAIAVGILVLISSIMLASYLCVRIKISTNAGPHINRTPSFSATSAPAAPLGIDGPTIDAYYPKLLYGRHVAPLPVVGPCAICLGDYVDGEMVRQVPECGHCFHAACVDAWLRLSATCPVCRSSPLPSLTPTPLTTPLSELIPLAVHGGDSS